MSKKPVPTFVELATAKLATLREGNTVSAGLTGKLVKSIAQRGKSLDVDIHVAAVAALDLSDMHRDCNTIKMLVAAMPKSGRTETLKAWFVKFGNVKFGKDKDGNVTCKMLPRDHEDHKVVDLGVAMATPFFLKPEKPENDWSVDDFAKAVASLIKKATANIDKMDDDAKAALADLKVAAVKLPTVENAK